MKLLSFAQGWKTYGAIAAGLVLGVAHHYGWDAPWYVNLVLAVFGAAALRSSVSVQASKSADDLEALINTILPAITAPDSASAIAALPQSVKLPSGRTVTLGKPSPAGQTDAEEKAETDALNAAQAK